MIPVLTSALECISLSNLYSCIVTSEGSAVAQVELLRMLKHNKRSMITTGRFQVRVSGQRIYSRFHIWPPSILRTCASGSVTVMVIHIWRPMCRDRCRLDSSRLFRGASLQGVGIWHGVSIWVCYDLTAGRASPNADSAFHGVLMKNLRGLLWTEPYRQFNLFNKHFGYNILSPVFSWL